MGMKLTNTSLTTENIIENTIAGVPMSIGTNYVKVNEIKEAYSPAEVRYSFNQLDQTVINDSSGYNRNATNSYTTVGVLSHPYITGGYSTICSFGSPITSTSTFTLNSATNKLFVSFWLSSPHFSGQSMPLVYHGNTPKVASSPFIDIGTAGEALNFGYTDGTTIRSLGIAGFFTGYSNSSWVKVGIEADYTAKSVKFYRNDVLFTTQTTTNTMLFDNTNNVLKLVSYYGGKISDFYMSTVGSLQLDKEALKLYNTKTVCKNVKEYPIDNS